jgi:anti-sigma-K factor RskA
VRSVSLRGDGASGTLWTVPRESIACLMIEDLPDPGDGNVYQIWLVRAGTPVSAGTFVPQGRESWTVVRADEPPASYESLGITIEPRGGSPAPTGPRVLQGSIDSSAAILFPPVAAAAP